MNPLRRLRAGLALLEPGQLALRAGRCPFCGPTLLLRLAESDSGVRCARCAAGSVQLSLGWALRSVLGSARGRDVCELSSRGPLVDCLRREARSLALSEYFDDVPPGEVRNGVRCEDVQRLSYADAAFDLILHSEVFEHVADDAAGFRELLRVLRPGGLMLFSVPLAGAAATVERARVGPEGVEHLLPSVYHSDLVRRDTGVLVFRDYGDDIVDRLRRGGFVAARIMPPDPRVPWGRARPVIHARKEGPADDRAAD